MQKEFQKDELQREKATERKTYRKNNLQKE